MLVFAVWPQTSCHNEIQIRALALACVYRHTINLGIILNDVITGTMNAYMTVSAASTFVTLYSINEILSLQARIYPENLRHNNTGWMPMRTARDTTALVRRTVRVHNRVVTVHVMWHVLWRKQWTLTTGTRMVVNIGVKPAHLNSTIPQWVLCCGSFIIYWSFCGKGQRTWLGQRLLVSQLQR